MEREGHQGVEALPGGRPTPDLFREAGDEGEPARERERRVGYLGFVAHEARTPLSTALWSVELLLRIAPEERAGARGEKLVATCRRALERLGHLVEDHLLAERLDADGLPVRREAVAVEELIASAVKRARIESWRAEGGLDLLVLADRALAEKALEGTLAAAARGGAAVAVRGRLAGGRGGRWVGGAAPPRRALEDPRRGAEPSDRARPLALPMARRAARAAGGRLAVEGGEYLLELPAA